MSWLDRQSFLGANSDEVLASLTVGLVGLGGGGSHVAQQLAHVGVGNFVVIDDDRITYTNLNRLVGATDEDVKNNVLKVDIAERVICGVNPSAKVRKYAARWQEVSDALKICDVVIGGLDSIRSKHELDGFTRRFMLPYIDMGMDVTETPDGKFLIAGQVVLTGPGEPCLKCLGVVKDEDLELEAQTYGAAGGKPQVVWPNGLLASTAVGLFVQLVTPWKDDTQTCAFLEYDGNRHLLREARALKLSRDRPCPHYRPSDVGDILFDIRRVSDRSIPMEMSVPKSHPSGIWRALVAFLKRMWIRR